MVAVMSAMVTLIVTDMSLTVSVSIGTPTGVHAGLKCDISDSDIDSLAWPAVNAALATK